MPASPDFSDMLLPLILAAGGGYLLGALPFGYLVARSRGVDIFSVGSKSPGATNVRRVLGTGPGNTVFVLDALKGAAAAGWPLLVVWQAVRASGSPGILGYVGLAAAFTEAFTRVGGTIVTEQAYRSGDTHFSAQLGTILAQNPEGIFCPGYYTEAALIAREARGQGFRGRFMGGDGWSSPSLVQNDDDKLVGDFYSVGFAPDGATSGVARHFADAFQAKYGYAPNDLAALAYDATLAMVAAIRRAGSAVPERIRAELAQTRNLDGATGLISLNEHRDAVKSAVILEVHENSANYHSTVNP